MALDSYSACVCGSGKKLKFCCQDVMQDLSRASSLRQNQPEVALQILRGLRAKHADKESVARELIGVLLDLNRTEEALAVGAEFLKTQPDNPLMLVTMSELRLVVNGFDSTRRLLHRAFQIASKTRPDDVASLAFRVSMEMLQRGSLFSAREHMTLALRLSRGDMQQRILNRLMSLEADRHLPSVCRTSWGLLPVKGSDEVLGQDQRARKLCLLGCFEPAAIVYNRLADQQPTDGAVWFNLGLCQLWDGRDREGGASLRHAATLLTDAEQAIDAEILAQLIEIQFSDDRSYISSVRLQVHSVSELVSRLRNSSNIRFLNSHDHENCQHFPGTDHVAEVVMLRDPVGTAGLDALPESLADVDVFDVIDEDAAKEAGVPGSFIEVTTLDRLLDAALVSLRDLLGDLILTGAADEKRERISSDPAALAPFDLRHVRPADMKETVYRRLTSEELVACIGRWTARPLAVLGGKTPQEAVAVPELRRPLVAAVVVLHELLGRTEMYAPVSNTFERLQLAPRSAVEIDSNAHLGTFNSLTLSRCNIATYPGNVLELGSRLGMLGKFDEAAQCFDRMIEQADSIDANAAVSAYSSRATMARVANDMELASSLLEKARTYVTGPEAFRLRLEMDIRQLSYCLDDPASPTLKTVLHRLRDQYLPKVPELRELITSQLIESGCSHLLPELEGSPSGSGSGQLWVPGTTPEDPAAGGKLWLPGQ